MTWIKRDNWLKPNLPDSAFVEIKGFDNECTKFGQVGDFCWDYPNDDECVISEYRLFSKFDKTVSETKMTKTEVRIPYESVLLNFADEQTAGMMMIWWEEFGLKNFTGWLGKVERGGYGDKE